MTTKIQIFYASILLLCFSLPLSAQIDLELSMAQSVEQADQWTNYSIDLIIKNIGPDEATDVLVDFQKPAGLVYVGGNQFSTSQGSFDVFQTEDWTVGSLAPGAEASLTVNYFQLVEQTPVAYAQVIAANETDVDSTPNNGTSPNPNEDDEANSIPNSNPQINFTCPADVAFSIPAGNGGICQGITVLPKPAATSTCAQGGLMVSYDSYTVISGDISIEDFGTSGFCPGIHVSGSGEAMVTFIATDACGTMATCSFMVTQSLINHSVIFENCPSTVQVTAEPGEAGAIVNYTYPTIVSLCTGIPSTSPANESHLSNSAYASGNFFPIGVYTVNMTAYCGPTTQANCTFQVEVLAPVDPPADGMDLELMMTQSVEQADQWSSYAIELVVKNVGTEKATGVEVAFSKPEGVIYVGGNEFTISQGSFVSAGSQIWEIGTIPPGEKAVITVNYFQTAETTPVAYAQVVAANETDVDSTPNNGTAPIPHEDDEASSTQSTCEIEAQLADLICLPRGNPDTNADDNYGIVFTVKNGNSNGSWIASNGGTNPPFSGTYGEPYTLDGGNLQSANSTGGLFLSIDITDELDPTCMTTLSWTVPGLSICLDPPTAADVDVELTMNSPSSIPKQWSHYAITLDVVNKGADPVTGLVVDIPLPDGLIYKGGDEYKSTQGILNFFTNHHWHVGDLPGNSSAIIEINYFLTVADLVNHYAQVAVQNEVDIDSSPGNGICCSPIEDDEAAFEYTPSQLRIAKPVLGEFLFYPNPVNEEITINLESVPTATNIYIYNALGQLAMEQKLDPEQLESKVTMNTSGLINGTYYLRVSGDGFKARGKVMFVQRTY